MVHITKKLYESRKRLHLINKVTQVLLKANQTLTLNKKKQVDIKSQESPIKERYKHGFKSMPLNFRKNLQEKGTFNHVYRFNIDKKRYTELKPSLKEIDLSFKKTYWSNKKSNANRINFEKNFIYLKMKTQRV
jgi:hypothetical protein